MKKNKFVTSTIILIIGGLVTKILSMFIRIIMTRYIGSYGIGIYMLLVPTFSLLISLCTLGMPTAISKLVSEDKKNNKKIVLNASTLILLIDIIIITLVYISSDFIANNLLHEPKTYYGILAMGIVLPFISISSILRGYFFGKQRMLPHVITNIVEDIVRLISIVLFVPFCLSKGIEFAVAFLILSNVFSELSSIIIFLILLPKKISKNDIKPNKSYIKDILDISIPSTGSRLIGNIGSFFEPIILTFVLLKVGYSNEFIVNEYGILNGFVMPLILLPSFFTMAISQALLPVVSKGYSNNNKRYVSKKIRQAIFFSLLIGIPCTLIFIFIPDIPLKLIYDTNLGIPYIKVLSIVCLLHYIQAPLTSSLQAMGLARCAMRGTLIGMILRTITLFLLSFLKIGLWGLVISTSINIIYVTVHHIIAVRNILKNSRN